MTTSKLLSGMFAAVVLVSLLAGCATTRYEYLAPASEQGRFCVVHCAGVREICQGNEINRAQADRYACEQRSESIFRHCQRNAANREDAQKCYRPACWASENTWRCDENYRQCFVACGGAIHVIREE